MLRIRSLGTLSVQGAGRAPAGTVIQPRRLAVLAVIGRAGDRGVTREKLLTLLWPDADEEAGRRALSQALYALRRDLGVDEPFLGIQELRLNPDAATCDAAEFESALAERNLERAAALYGGWFLDGFRLPNAPDFDRWVDDERRALAHRHAELLERLARRAAERGDPSEASSWWRRLAQLDPLNARVAVELMRSLVATGDPGGALKHARIYEALLAQELDLEPDRQVIELAQRIRQDVAAVATPTPAPASPVGTTGAAAATEPNAATVSGIAGRPATETGPVRASAPQAADIPGEETIPPGLPNAARDGAPVSARRSAWPRRRVVSRAAAVVAVGILGSALAWWGGPGRRAAGNASVLAVGRIVDYRSTDGRDADAVSDMLATNLARVRGLQVLSSARLYEVMAQIGDQRTAARAAQRAGASELLEGGLHSLAGGRLLLDLRRIDLETGAIRTAYRLEGTDVYALVGQATEDLARSLDHPSGRLDPADVSTRSLVAYRFYQEGLRSYGRGDYRGAERLLDAALAEDSSFAMAAFYLVMTRIALGAPQPADTWDRVGRLADRAPERERLLIRGTWAMHAGRADLRPIADSLASRYPTEVDGPYLQGNARLQTAEFIDAIPYLERALAMDSLGLREESAWCRACEAITQLIYAYSAIDSLAAAERLARDYVRRQPRSARSWMSLAGVLVAQNRHEEAIDAQRTATSINPMNSYDRVFPAVIRIRSGEFEEADRLARTLMRNGTPVDSDQARWVLVLSLRYQGRWREALGLLQESLASLSAIDRASTTGRALRNMEALVRLEAGQPLRAAAVWDSLVRHAPPGLAAGPPAARYYTLEYTLLATALAAANDTTRLAAAVEAAAGWSGKSINRRDAGLADHARGLLLMARGDTTGAIAAFARAVYSPTSGFTRTNRDLGALLLARGRAADAARLLGAALRGPTLESGSLWVTHTELHDLLARAYHATGMTDSARVHYQYVASALAGSDAGVRDRYEGAKRWLETHAAPR
jgi:DNA-binding SARP family transcriptional activator/TolB-like protein